MSGKDQDRLKVLHEVRKRHITQQQAGVELGISPGWVRVLLKRMKFEGDRAVVHRLRGRPSNRKLPAWMKPRALGLIRRWLRGQCEQHRIADRMPADPEVTAAELLELGFAPEAVNGVRRARDLFERFRDHRNAIAHFLVEGEQGKAHVYLADGVMIRTYCVGAAGLLKYAHQTLRELRMFYTAHLEPILMRGMVLPLPEQKGSLCCA
jgi:hypothetical protein